MNRWHSTVIGASVLLSASALSVQADTLRDVLERSRAGQVGPSPAQRILAQSLAQPSPSNVDPPLDPEQLPQWFKSAEQLKQLLGGRTPGTIAHAEVIRRQATEIEGLEALIVQATIEDDNGPPRDELFVFYTDPSDTYLVVGMMVDMENNENLTQLALRGVRGEIAETPGLALSPLMMHHIAKAGKGDLDQDPVLLVIDLGPEKGRENFLNIVRFHDKLLDQREDVRPLYVLPVSTARDELSVGAMAMALGYDLLSQDGFDRLVEYAEQGAQAPWLDKDRLANDPALKQAMGMGIFRLQDNSEQALLARLDTLPLVYRVVSGTAGLIPTPTDSPQWAALFLDPSASAED